MFLKCFTSSGRTATPSAILSAVLLVAAMAGPSGCLPAAAADVSEQQAIAEKWGVEILGVGLSGAGYMLDFRYKVVDGSKAGALTRRQDKPYILDQASGARFGVMRGPKLGSMRNTSLKPVAGRNYSIIFVNPARYVKAGNKVTVVVGEFKAENLEVH